MCRHHNDDTNNDNHEQPTTKKMPTSHQKTQTATVQANVATDENVPHRGQSGQQLPAPLANHNKIYVAILSQQHQFLPLYFSYKNPFLTDYIIFVSYIKQ